MDIKDGTVEGFVELLQTYGNNLDQLAELWIGLSTDTEEEDIPPEVWIADSRPVKQLAEILIAASADLSVVWVEMPVDLRDTVNIMVRKVKTLEEAT